MIYKIIIPARKNSKRLPNKNMKILVNKPLIQYSIDFALDNFHSVDIWVNSDCEEIIEFAKLFGVNTINRPPELATDYTPTVDVLNHNISYFKKNNIKCESVILLQPTNPLRDKDLLKIAIEKFENSNRNSLSTFSMQKNKIGFINNAFFKPDNYIPGQRSQDLTKQFFENGQLYITKCKSILNGKIITEDVFPLICDNVESEVDIDTIEDFLFAKTLIEHKNKNKKDEE